MNEYDSDHLARSLIINGYIPVDNPANADIILINTCAVRAKPEQKAASFLGRMIGIKKKNPHIILGVAGCMAQHEGIEFIRRFPQVDLVMGPREIDRFQEHLQRIQTDQEKVVAIDLNFLPPKPIHCEGYFKGRVTGFVSIMEGCNNFCTYCIVPAARGPSRSQPKELVLSQAESLSSAGYLEILLTGVDLVRYGSDIYCDDYGLVNLVRDLLEKGGFRIRLSSMEPIGLSTEMLEGLAYPGVCRHLHIPVQSGSDRILEKMGRMYSSNEIIELFDRSIDLFPGISIGADVIVGFPGETEKDFQKTVDLISHPGVAYLHVFPFSARPGTPAASMRSEMIHTETITARAHYLRSLSLEKRNRFRRSQIGTDVLVLVESRTGEDGDRLIGMTDNYIPVFSPQGSREGEMVQMTLTERDICWDVR